MIGIGKVIFLCAVLTAFSIIPKAEVLSFPVPPAAGPDAPLLHQVHGDHCSRRYSKARGWHRHQEACRERVSEDRRRGWCWQDAYGNQLCFGDIRRRDLAECRSNAYALGCRTEKWDNR
jgi:hypothetical protein